MDTIKTVEEFNRTFDVPILNNSEEAQIDRRALRIKLLFEELQELAVATGCGEDFHSLCERNRLVRGDRDRVEELDALTDLQYVLDGTYLELGHWKNKYEAFKRVHESNMSKICSKIEAEDLVDELTEGIKGGFYNIVEKESIKSNYNCYVVRYDGKIMKPFSYKPVDLKDLI